MNTLSFLVVFHISRKNRELKVFTLEINHLHRMNEVKRDTDVYAITLNCDEHQVSIIKETTREQE